MVCVVKTRGLLQAIFYNTMVSLLTKGREAFKRYRQIIHDDDNMLALSLYKMEVLRMQFDEVHHWLHILLIEKACNNMLFILPMLMLVPWFVLIVLGRFHVSMERTIIQFVDLMCYVLTEIINPRIHLHFQECLKKLLKTCLDEMMIVASVEQSVKKYV